MLVNRALCGFLGIQSATIRQAAVQRYIPDRLRARLNAGAEVLDKAVARVENTGKIKPFGNVIVAGTAGQKERHAGKSPFY